MADARPSSLSQAGPSTPREASLEMEEVTEMIARVRWNSSIFRDRELAKKLLNLILLPRDQEDWKSQSVDEVLANLFSQVPWIDISQSLLG